MTRFRRSVVVLATASVLVATLGLAVPRSVGAAVPPTLNLNVLLIGTGSSDPTTAAWQSALSSEGVAYTSVTATGASGSETVVLPALTTGSVGNFNGVVLADSPTAFAAGQLSALDTYESTYGVRQIDGYMYPSPALGLTDASAGALDGTTAQLTPAGLAALAALKGTVPFDTGTYGAPATIDAGAPLTPWLENASGQVLAGVYQHPGTDPQAGVAELALTFDYSATMLQWLLLAPGLINWVTQDTHLGLYRNYFGQDIDDNFIADNSWSSQYQCTPGATQPPDYTCPAGVANNPADTPPDVQMSATDVAYVVAWEQQTGIKLNLAFNGIGACTAPTTAAESSANCTGSVTDAGGTYTDPGQVVDTTAPNDQALVNALLANQSSFNWVNHTWSHQFLGCIAWQPQAVNSVTANASGGSFTAGGYTYEVTAATAYGESEPSLPQSATVGANGSVTLSWPDATNGGGPTLAQEEANHTGGSGFWGYYVYRENPGSTTFGLVGQVAENPLGTTPTYSFTDAGTAPGAAPGSGAGFPTATNPGIDCSSAPGSWEPATSGSPDSSIGQEIGLDQAFAAANGLTNYSPSVLITGEHSGVENPNMPAALAGAGVTTFATDASRQPTPYSLTSGASTATSAPRYPSNIYYNASTWADQLNEYNTLYVAPGVSIGPGETGHCAASSSTTCLTAPATESSMLASESRIMLSHVLANNPRVGYAHQTNLIGPATANGADSGYTLLSLINNMLSQYNAWTTTPLIQMTDATDAQTLGLQNAWATAQGAGSVKATEVNGVVTVTNSSGTPVSVPVTVPPGTTVGGAAFGQSYGGELSAWTTVPAAGTATLTENVGPTISSANAATSIVGTPFSDTVATTGEPAPALTETGALPKGLTFTDNGNGTATLAGTAASGSGGSYPITITATSTSGTATQAFTLTNAEAPAITSLATATFSTGVAGTYTVTTTGYPAATITESGALPAGLTFTAGLNGTATINGTTTAGVGTYPVTISATNVSGSTAQLALTITVAAAKAPAITSGSSAFFTLKTAGAFAVTTTGSPVAAITEVGTLPAGLTYLDQGNGTALISGTPTATGTTNLAITAANGITPAATQTLSLVVGQAPAISSAATTTFDVGPAGSFSVTTTGYPAPTLGETGALPAGVTFVGNSNGTATISGTPAAGTVGSYPITITATNGSGTITQSFTLNVAIGATVSGTVTDAQTKTPLAGVCAYLYTTGGTRTTDPGVCSGANGNYVMPVTAPGSYNVAFFDTSGIFVTADKPVTLTDGTTVTGIDAALVPVVPQGVSGQVIDSETGAPIGGVCVYLYKATPANTRTGDVGFCTDANGYYTMQVAAPGSYDVAFFDPSGLHDTVWAGGSALQSGATAVTVTANQDTTGVNVQMIPAVVTGIMGTVTDATTGQGLAGICMYLYTTAGVRTSDVGTCTNSGGNYLMPIAAPGSYDVAFTDPAGGPLTGGNYYATQWSGGSATQTGAVAVTITTGKATENVDAAMTGAQ